MSPRDLTIPGERHPEKAHRPDNAQPKKPDWIRVKAPTSEGYKATRDIMRENRSSPSARRRAARTSANAGARATPP
jgi:hypothetical protein